MAPALKAAAAAAAFKGGGGACALKAGAVGVKPMGTDTWARAMGMLELSVNCQWN